MCTCPSFGTVRVEKKVMFGSNPLMTEMHSFLCFLRDNDKFPINVKRDDAVHTGLWNNLYRTDRLTDRGTDGWMKSNSDMCVKWVHLHVIIAMCTCLRFGTVRVEKKIKFGSNPLKTEMHSFLCHAGQWWISDKCQAWWCCCAYRPRKR